MQSGLLQFLFIICAGVSSFPTANIFKAKLASQDGLTQPISSGYASQVNSYPAVTLPSGTISSPVQLSQSTGTPYNDQSNRNFITEPVSVPSFPRGASRPKGFRSIVKSGSHRSGWGFATGAVAGGVGRGLGSITPVPLGAGVVSSGAGASAVAFPDFPFYPAGVLTPPPFGASLADAAISSFPAELPVGSGGLEAAGRIGVGIEGSGTGGASIGANVESGVGAGISDGVGSRIGAGAQIKAGVSRRAVYHIIGNFLPNFAQEHGITITTITTRSPSHATGIIPVTVNAGASYLGATVDTVASVLGV